MLRGQYEVFLAFNKKEKFLKQVYKVFQIPKSIVNGKPEKKNCLATIEINLSNRNEQMILQLPLQ